MPTFRTNVHLGTKDPLVQTDDISDEAITQEKLSPELQAWVNAVKTTETISFITSSVLYAEKGSSEDLPDYSGSSDDITI